MRYAENQKQLIDRVKLALNAGSFYSIGKILGMSDRTLSKAYKNTHFLTDYYIFLLCDVTKLDAAQTLACIRKEEAETKGRCEVANVWEKFTKKHLENPDTLSQSVA